MNWKEIPNVAMYGNGDWSGFVEKVPNCNVETAKEIAENNPKISFFFICKDDVNLNKGGYFNRGDAVFFNGEPHYGSAPQCDIFQKENNILQLSGTINNFLVSGSSIYKDFYVPQKSKILVASIVKSIDDPSFPDGIELVVYAPNGIQYGSQTINTESVFAETHSNQSLLNLIVRDPMPGNWKITISGLENIYFSFSIQTTENEISQIVFDPVSQTTEKRGRDAQTQFLPIIAGLGIRAGLGAGALILTAGILIIKTLSPNTTADDIKRDSILIKGLQLFKNFRTVEENVLYRSAQPNYNGKEDTQHIITDAQIQFLKNKNIKTIISANQFSLSYDVIENLNNQGISYFHYEIEDYQAPEKQDLIVASKKIQEAKSKGYASLIYCGAGFGRTGTFVVAWEILSGKRNYIAEEIKEITTVETDEQVKVLLELQFGELKNYPKDEL